MVIGVDFSGHIGEGNRGEEEVMSGYGVKERNVEGKMVVDFMKRMEMAVVNTYFKKREEHRMTYKSGGRCTQVDYVLCRRCNLKEIGDCKVVAGKNIVRQHQIVVCTMTLETKKRKKVKEKPRIKWWKLEKEDCCEEFREELRTVAEWLGNYCRSGDGDRLEGTWCVIWTKERRQGDLVLE
eukprot:superscaffoldBa00001440_g10570